MIKLKYVQPIGDQNCLLYGLANLFNNADYLEPEVIEAYSMLPPMMWEDINKVVQNMSGKAVGAHVIACLPTDSIIGLQSTQMYTPIFLEGFEVCDDFYRVFMELRKSNNSLAVKDLHSVFLIVGKKGLYELDPARSEVRYFEGSPKDTLRAIRSYVHGMFELTLHNGAYGFTITEEKLKQIFIYE